MTAQLQVGAWLAFWAACCSLLAGRPLPPDIKIRFETLFVPALAVGLAATILREPGRAFLEGSAAVMLVSAGIVDSRTGYLFDAVTLPCAAICTLASILSQSAWEAAATVLVLVMPLAALASISRGNWLGWGDVKACFSLAVAFGPIEAPATLFIATLSGLLSACISSKRRRTIPFGPHLARGAVLTLILAPLAHRLEAFVR